MKETGASDKQKDRRQTLDRLFFDPENNVNNVTNDILIRTENNAHKRKFKILRNLIWKCFYCVRSTELLIFPALRG